MNITAYMKPFWISIMWKELHCHWWLKVNLPLQAMEQTSEYGMKTLNIPLQKEVQISTNSGKSYIHTILRCAWISPEALSTKGCENQQCTLHWNAVWWAEDRNSEYMARTNVKSCSIPASPFWSPHCWNIPAAILWNLRTSMTKLQEAMILPVTMRWRTQSICGFPPGQKHFF